MAKAVNIARSHRLDGIGEYYFSRRLREIAEIEAATGRQIVKLAMGSPDLPPHPSVIDASQRRHSAPTYTNTCLTRENPSCARLLRTGIRNGTARNWTTTTKYCP